MFLYLSGHSYTQSSLGFVEGRSMRDILSIIFSSKLKSEKSEDNRLLSSIKELVSGRLKIMTLFLRLFLSITFLTTRSIVSFVTPDLFCTLLLPWLPIAGIHDIRVFDIFDR